MLFVDHLEKWLRADTPGYNMKLKDFEYANKSLKLAAHEKNIDWRDHRLHPTHPELRGVPQAHSRHREVAFTGANRIRGSCRRAAGG